VECGNLLDDRGEHSRLAEAAPYSQYARNVSMRQHTSAYVSIRQHTSAYVSIRQHTSVDGTCSRRSQQAAAECPCRRLQVCRATFLAPAAYVSISIRKLTSAYAYIHTHRFVERLLQRLIEMVVETLIALKASYTSSLSLRSHTRA
jgi:hypothetical protein